MNEPTSTGVDARLSSVLCYAGWWVTGLVFLFAERRHSGVRFHAAQSIVVFGALSVALFLCGGASAVAFFMAVPTFQLVQTLGNVLWLGRRRALVVPAAENVARRDLAGAGGRRPREEARRYIRKAANVPPFTDGT